MIQTSHTADLEPATLSAARALLYDVFDDMTEHDWEHSLGGVHAIAWDGDVLVGHAAVVQRRLLHGGRALRAGYVEGVGVRAGHRRQGHAAAMMDALERVVRNAYDLGALGATDEAVPFYTAARLEAVGGTGLGLHARRHPAHARRGRRDLRPPGHRPARPLGRADLRLAGWRRVVGLWRKPV